MKRLGLSLIHTKYYFEGVFVNKELVTRVVYEKKGKRVVYWCGGYRTLEEGPLPVLKIYQAQLKRPIGTLFEQIAKAGRN